MKVLFVCTGNLCRSPMAEALMRRALDERGCTDVAVASAGTWAHDDSPATYTAAAVLADAGIDLSQHRSRPLARDEVMAADIVIVMTSVHQNEVLQTAPEAGGKIRLLKELGEIDAPIDAGAPAPRRLAALLDGRRPEYRRALDVDDPIGLPASAYERCRRELEVGVEVLADVLCGLARRRSD